MITVKQYDSGFTICINNRPVCYATTQRAVNSILLLLGYYDAKVIYGISA